MTRMDVSVPCWCPIQASFAFRRIASIEPEYLRMMELNFELIQRGHLTGLLFPRFPRNLKSLPFLVHSFQVSWHFLQRAFQRFRRIQCLKNQRIQHGFYGHLTFSFYSKDLPINQAFQQLSLCLTSRATDTLQTYAS